MPLITNLLPSREHVDAFDSTPLHAQHRLEQVREEPDSTTRYEDFTEYKDDEDDVLDSDMEGSILHRPRPKKAVKTPILPPRSEKRASKILETVMQDLKTFDDKETAKEESQRMSVLTESDPHELYLSSEEDASLSDDYEGSLMDFEESDGEHPRGRQTSRASRRRSQEDTARVVSFIVVGKPQIVNIFNTSPSAYAPISRHSMNLDALTSFKSRSMSSSPLKPAARRPAPLKLYPSSIRRMSISSTTSYIPPASNSPIAATMQHQNSSMINLAKVPSHAPHNSMNSIAHPTRKSSRLGFSNLTSLVTSHTSSSRQTSLNMNSNPTPITASSTHSFLNSDPFAHPHHHHEATHNLPPSPVETPTTPKTPNSLAMWKKGLSRTLSKANRRPSMGKLTQSYHSHAASSSTLSLSSNATSTTTHTTTTMHPRSSTSYGHPSVSTLSSLNLAAAAATATEPAALARITSNPEPATPKLLSSQSHMSEQMMLSSGIKRSETMPVLERGSMRGPPPVSASEPHPQSQKSVKDWRKERRSFGIMRKRSLKK
jgi:hypothetical protein